MSRAVPPSAPTPSGTPDPNRRPAGQPHAAAHKVNVPISHVGHKPGGASPFKPGGAVPGAAKPASGNGASSAAKPPTTPSLAGVGGATLPPGAIPAASSMPPIDQLQGRPIGRVLTKMGKVT